ncbi:MAG: hypothetical protein K9K86_11135 [Pseudomonadales bacterium]|nr:hypothetical protein [Pseudomonadales bacterium]
MDNTNTSLKRFSVVCPNTDLESSLTIGSELIAEDYLIVLVDIPLNQVFAINLDSIARFPIRLPYDELIEHIDNDRVFLASLEMDKRVTLDEDLLNKGYRAKMEKRWLDILPLTLNLDVVLRNGYGEKIFDETRIKSGKSKQYIYDTFYSWLRHGCRKQGLGMPQGKDANHLPKTRVIHVKQGATNKGIPRGKILDERDFKNFQFGFRLYRKKNGPSINKTIHKIWEKHYFKTRSKNTALEQAHTGKKYSVQLLPAHERPSYHQFYFWLNKQYDGNLPKRDKTRKNATEYAANDQGRPGNAFFHIIAPGELFQLDETPFDEEMVSVFDSERKTKIGKATIYFVRDTFSRAIVGLYITLLRPSFATAKEALFNAARDKKEFLAEIGCPLDPALWNIQGVPMALLVDKAEFHNKVSEGPITDLPINIKFTRGGRGDDKPLAETIFNSFSKFFQGVSPAHQTKSHRDIALQLARKNACLTIPELYQIALVYIEHYNNKHVIKDYPLTREMIRDDVKPIPIQLWTWGLQNRPGYLSDFSESELYLKLLEKGEVTLHRNHVYLKDKGLRYNCEWTLAEGLQDRRSSGNKAKVFPCRYFRGLVDMIFLCTPDGLKLATLDAKDIAYSGLSFEEVHAYKEAGREPQDLLKEDEINSLISVSLFLEDTLRNARAQRIPSSMPNLAKINENRAAESIFDRVHLVNRFVQAICSEHRQTPSVGHQTLFSDEPNAAHSEHDDFYAKD